MYQSFPKNWLGMAVHTARTPVQDKGFPLRRQRRTLSGLCSLNGLIMPLLLLSSQAQKSSPSGMRGRHTGNPSGNPLISLLGIRDVADYRCSSTAQVYMNQLDLNPINLQVNFKTYTINENTETLAHSRRRLNAHFVYMSR